MSIATQSKQITCVKIQFHKTTIFSRTWYKPLSLFLYSNIIIPIFEKIYSANGEADDDTEQIIKYDSCTIKRCLLCDCVSITCTHTLPKYSQFTGLLKRIIKMNELKFSIEIKSKGKSFCPRQTTFFRNEEKNMEKECKENGVEWIKL